MYKIVRLGSVYMLKARSRFIAKGSLEQMCSMKAACMSMGLTPTD